MRVENIGYASATIQINNHTSSELSDLGWDWVDAAFQEPSFQTGSIDVNQLAWEAKTRGSLFQERSPQCSMRVNFDQLFDKKPIVRVFLNGISLDASEVPNCRSWTSDVDCRGFTVNFTSTCWINVPEWNARHLTYVAYDEDNSGILSGKFKAKGHPTTWAVGKGSDHDKLIKVSQGSVRFKKRVFTRSQRVMLALSGFKFNKTDSIRLDVRVQDVRADGFLWELLSRGDSKLAKAWVSWIFFGTE